MAGWSFGQVAAANAGALFAASRPLAHVPAIGTAKDRQPCPTTRDFSLVDQDPSDNVTTQYIVTGSGQTAQDNAANEQALGTSLASNGSDNNLLARFVDPALGCTPFEAADRPVLASSGQVARSGAGWPCAIHRRGGLPRAGPGSR